MAMNSFLPLLGMALLWVGCDSKSNSSTGTSSDPSTASRSEGAPLIPGTESTTSDKERTMTANPAAETGVALSAPQSAAPRSPQEVTVALDELTQALRKYSAEKQRVPKNLTEVTAAGYLKGIPQAPPGKKFAIKPERVEVILVNQ